jgi:hypothetical protein
VQAGVGVFGNATSHVRTFFDRQAVPGRKLAGQYDALAAAETEPAWHATLVENVHCDTKQPAVNTGQAPGQHSGKLEYGHTCAAAAGAASARGTNAKPRIASSEADFGDMRTDRACRRALPQEGWRNLAARQALDRCNLDVHAGSRTGARGFGDGEARQPRRFAMRLVALAALVLLGASVSLIANPVSACTPQTFGNSLVSVTNCGNPVQCALGTDEWWYQVHTPVKDIDSPTCVA